MRVNDLDRLIAIEDIKQLKARYFRALDTQDWALLESVFAEDAIFDFSQANIDPHFPVEGYASTPPVQGRTQIVEAIRSTIVGFATVHHGHIPEIDIGSDSTATGIWPMEERVHGITGETIFDRNGFGHYHETYEKVDGAWQIKTSRIERLRVDFA